MLAFFSIITASFQSFFIINFLIIIHEIGHTLVAYLFKVKVEKIYLYPLGGIAKFNMDLNISPVKELLILVAGPFFQCLAYFILLFVIPTKTDLIKVYHYGILLFNLLPIYPLDGGKILQLFLEKIFPYQLSFKIIFVISYLSLIILCYLLLPLSINGFTMILLLFFFIEKERHKIDNIYNKFLLERYLKKYSFKKCELIQNEKNFYRGKRHLIKEGDSYCLEKDFLEKKYHI